MANLTFQIPDDKMEELLEAWSVGYAEKVIDPDNSTEWMSNPQPKDDFAIEQIRNMIAERVRIYAVSQVADFPIT